MTTVDERPPAIVGVTHWILWGALLIGVCVGGFASLTNTTKQSSEGHLVGTQMSRMDVMLTWYALAIAVGLLLVSAIAATRFARRDRRSRLIVVIAQGVAILNGGMLLLMTGSATAVYWPVVAVGVIAALSLPRAKAWFAKERGLVRWER